MQGAIQIICDTFFYGGGGYRTVSPNITRGREGSAKVSRGDIFSKKTLICCDVFALKIAVL